MEYSVLLFAYLVAAAMGTAVLHSVGGFAGALLMAIAVALALGVKETVPVVATAMMISHASRAWLFRKAVDWDAFRMLACLGCHSSCWESCSMSNCPKGRWRCSWEHS